MATFDESIVREYFERNGFLVRQVRKYQVRSRKKRAEEEIDLLVYNPDPEEPGATRGFQLFSGDIRSLQRALVIVRGWHTTSFTPRMLRQSGKIFEFLKNDVFQQSAEYLAEDQEAIGRIDPAATLLVLPGIPSNEPTGRRASGCSASTGSISSSPSGRSWKTFSAGSSRTRPTPNPRPSTSSASSRSTT